MEKLELSQIYPNPDQPRKHFSRSKLEDLAQSIKECGLLEPIVVVKRRNGYMILAGERRFHACKMAGLKKAPVRVLSANRQKVAELSLLENLQREDLNLIEEANAYQGLLEMGLTMEELAQKMGFKQTWRIKERLNLLRLHQDYKDALVEKRLTPSQAQEISRLPHDKQHQLYDMIMQGKADTYNKLRSLANHLLVPPPEQTELAGPELTEKEKAVGQKYDRMVERLVSFIKSSFDPEDLKVLPRVTGSNVSVNIEQLEIAIRELNKIKRAMMDAESAQEIHQVA